MFENDEMCDVPNDMLVEYQKVSENGKYTLLELSDRYVHPDGVSYELVEKLFPNYQVRAGKDYFIVADGKIYHDDSEF